MATLRTYGERCSLARALDLIGERWALLVVRELLLGPKRFTDLREGMPNAKPSVLSQRLRELEEGGVLRRRKLGPPARTYVYELTETGHRLEPVMIALGRWGRALPVGAGTAHHTEHFVLALKWVFDGSRADDLDGLYELRFGEDRYCAEVVGRDIEVRRGEASQPDVVIESDAVTMEAVVFSGRAIEDAERDGRLTIEGDRDLASRFLGHYLPATAVPAAT